MLFQTAYHTTLGRAIQTDKITRAIKESLIRDPAYEEEQLGIGVYEQHRVLFNTGLGDRQNVPLFAHPLVIPHISGETIIATDIRQFIRYPATEEPTSFKDFVVTNQAEFTFAKQRSVLQLIWLTDEPQRFLSDLPLACTVFSAWLSESISKRYALDPKDQLSLTLIAYFYYHSLHYPLTRFAEEDIQKFVIHAVKATRASAEWAFDIFDRIGEMGSLEDFCRHAREILENIRLKDFDTGMLLTIISNSWYGVYAKEVLAVSLEHPPTWLAILQSAMTDRTYRTSLIARVAERYARGKTSDNHIKTFNSIIQEFTQPDYRHP